MFFNAPIIRTHDIQDPLQKIILAVDIPQVMLSYKETLALILSVSCFSHVHKSLKQITVFHIWHRIAPHPILDICTWLVPFTQFLAASKEISRLKKSDIAPPQFWNFDQCLLLATRVIPPPLGLGEGSFTGDHAGGGSSLDMMPTHSPQCGLKFRVSNSQSSVPSIHWLLKLKTVCKTKNYHVQLQISTPSLYHVRTCITYVYVIQVRVRDTGKLNKHFCII